MLVYPPEVEPSETTSSVKHSAEVRKRRNHRQGFHSVPKYCVSACSVDRPSVVPWRCDKGLNEVELSKESLK